MRYARSIPVRLAAAALCGSLCALATAQTPPAAPPAAQATPPDVIPEMLPPSKVALDVVPTDVTAPAPTDSASLDGCQVIARIDGQVVLACEVLWHVNLLLEANRDKFPAEKLDDLRAELLKREVIGLVDRKLLYAEFRRNIPAENLPHIAEQLDAPFENKELPQLMKQLKVENRADLEKELTRLGSSLADVRNAFNERAIATEWMRSKIKIDEEVSPDEMIQYYQSHLTDYDFPMQVRWEELMVRKSRFKSSGEAYAEIAQMGNEVWQRAASKPNPRGPAFADVAKAKSDGFTAKDGGIHDWTSKGSLKTAAIDNSLFTLQVGQLSPIVESETGFHIVRVLERKEAGRKQFIDVQPDIRDKLKDERFKVAVDKYLGTLRDDARIWTAYTGPVSADVLLGKKPGDTQNR